MHSKTDDFMTSLRERIEAKEKENAERMAALRRRAQADHSGDVHKRPSWIKNAPARNRQRNSLLGLLRGEVTTQSSTHRSQKS